MSKKNTMRTILGVAVCALVGVAGGCFDDGTADGDEGKPLPAPLTTLVTDDGTAVAFYELPGGDLVTVASGELSESLEGATPVALYEALAHAPAPSALREVEDRIAAHRVHRVDDVDATDATVVAPPARAAIANLTGPDFQSAWCNPGVVDFDYCYTQRTNDWSVDITSVDWIHSHANACDNGTFTHRMQIKHPPFGTFNVVNADTVTGGTYVSTFSETDNGTYRIEILQAAGDCWNLSIHGNK